MSWSAVPSSPEMTIGRKAVLKTAGRESGIFLSAAACPAERFVSQGTEFSGKQKSSPSGCFLCSILIMLFPLNRNVSKKYTRSSYERRH